MVINVSRRISSVNILIIILLLDLKTPFEVLGATFTNIFFGAHYAVSFSVLSHKLNGKNTSLAVESTTIT